LAPLISKQVGVLATLCHVFRFAANFPCLLATHSFHTYAATKIVEVPSIAPAEGEIEVSVSHTGIEASDIVQMVGGYGRLAGKTPATSWDGNVQVGDCGCEGVGTVTAVGAGVSNFAVGDAVAFVDASFRQKVRINVSEFKSGTTPQVFKVPAPTADWTAVVSLCPPIRQNRNCNSSGC
jgi:NADPH:quinone reductase-like Zn-dependent oxidoreductase